MNRLGTGGDGNLGIGELESWVCEWLRIWTEARLADMMTDGTYTLWMSGGYCGSSVLVHKDTVVPAWPETRLTGTMGTQRAGRLEILSSWHLGQCKAKVGAP